MAQEIKLDKQSLGNRMTEFLQNARCWHMQKNYQEYQYFKGRFVECCTWCKDLGFTDLYELGLKLSLQFNMMDKIFEN